VAGLLALQTGQHVDQHHAAHQLGRDLHQADGHEPAGRHTNHAMRVRGQAAHDGGDVVGSGQRRSVIELAAARSVGVPVAGQVHRH
jgi:hypothetical protein